MSSQPETPKERLVELADFWVKSARAFGLPSKQAKDAKAAFTAAVSSLFPERTEGEDEIERVARVIAVAAGHLCKWEELPVTSKDAIRSCEERGTAACQDDYRDQARAAIAALSPPARDTRESGRGWQPWQAELLRLHSEAAAARLGGLPGESLGEHADRVQRTEKAFIDFLSEVPREAAPLPVSPRRMMNHE